MRREILAILLISTLANAAMDQAYTHTVSREGTSEITRSIDISIFTTELEASAIEKMKEICEEDPQITCSVEGNTIAITEEFSPEGYYKFEAEYGLPEITYTLTQKKIPADRFSISLDKLLLEAGAIEESKPAPPIDLTDREKNVKTAELLERFKITITYTINMPTPIYEAYAGNISAPVSGSSVTFDIVEVMAESEPIVVRSRELNTGYLIIIAAVMIVGLLALLFFRKRPGKRKK